MTTNGLAVETRALRKTYRSATGRRVVGGSHEPTARGRAEPPRGAPRGALARARGSRARGARRGVRLLELEALARGRTSSSRRRVRGRVRRVGVAERGLVRRVRRGGGRGEGDRPRGGLGLQVGARGARARALALGADLRRRRQGARDEHPHGAADHRAHGRGDVRLGGVLDRGDRQLAHLRAAPRAGPAREDRCGRTRGGAVRRAHVPSRGGLDLRPVSRCTVRRVQ